MTLDLLRFMTAGSVDDGKSTLIGRLLYDSKQILDDLIDRVEISPDKHAQPYFRIPDNTKPRPPRAGASATPVGIGSQDVEVAGIEPASFGTSPGLLRAEPALVFLSPGVHAGESPTGSATVCCPA